MVDNNYKKAAEKRGKGKIGVSTFHPEYND